MTPAGENILSAVDIANLKDYLVDHKAMSGRQVIEIIVSHEQLRAENERLKDWMRAARQFAWAHERTCPRRVTDGDCNCGLDEFLGRPRPYVESFRDEIKRLQEPCSCCRERGCLDGCRCNPDV